MSNEIKKTLSKTHLWSYIREQRIVYNHKKTAEYCKELIKEYFSSDQVIPVHALKDLPSDKIIWQYWGQGFENLPAELKQCIDSVDKWKGDYSVIRLDDSSIEYYLDLPLYIQEAKQYMSRAHFSDLLRVCLLSLYGGIWMDASIYMSGPVPKYVFENDFSSINGTRLNQIKTIGRTPMRIISVGLKAFM